MRKFTTYLFWLLFTPLISFLCWLFASHQLTQYLNIIFYVSFIFVIILFSLIIVQEGILDPTSYGFRRLKYQLTNKKSSYFVNPWIKVGFVFNLLYLLISIAISFII